LFLIFTIPGYLNKKKLDKILILEIFMTKSDEALTAFTSGSPVHRQLFLHFLMNWGLTVRQQRRLLAGSVLESRKSGNIRGANSGAIMVKGLKYGKTHPEDKTGC
jgi:hypothetical protein